MIKDEDTLVDQAEELLPTDVSLEDSFHCDLIELRRMRKGNGWKEVESYMRQRIEDIRDKLLEIDLDYGSTMLLRGMALNCAQILAYVQLVEETLLEVYTDASNTNRQGEKSE